MPARYPLRVVGAEGRDEVSFVLDVGKKPFEIIVTPPSGTAKIGWGLEIGGIGVVAATATVCGILYSPGAAWYAGLGTGLGIGVAAMAAGIYLITTSPKGDIKLVPIPLPPGTEQKK
jgi:hypothetical protein